MFKFLLGVAFGAACYWAWQSFGRDLLGLGGDQDSYSSTYSNTSFNSGTSTSYGSSTSTGSSSIGASPSPQSTASSGSTESTPTS